MDDLDGLGVAEHLDGGVGDGHAEVLVDDLRAGDGGDVLEDALAAVTEAGGLDGDDIQRAAQLVEQQGGQGLALDVLGDRASADGRSCMMDSSSGTMSWTLLIFWSVSMM